MSTGIYFHNTADVMENENPAWKVHVSNFALRTFNPIRHIVENMKIEPNSDKPMIALSLGND